MCAFVQLLTVLLLRDKVKTQSILCADPDFPHRLFLIGQKRVACYCITQIGDSIDLVLQNDFTAQDWIWDVFPVNPQLRASYPAFFNGLSDIKELWVLGTAHNVVEVWDPVEKLRYVQIRGESQSVLHSLRFHFRSDNNRFYVASGTVFNQVLVWEPLLSTKLKKCLIGHEGVVWGVLWDARGNHIASWSDDRSARVWDITDIDQGSVYAIRSDEAMHDFVSD
jgi:WD40 repeat protein